MGLCALIVAVAMVSIGVTWALYSDTKSETNVLTIGDVDIKLWEKYEGEKYGITDTSKAVNKSTPITPDADTVIAKEVWVENTGNLSCYVRVLVRRKWYDRNNNEVTNINTLTGLSLEMIEPQYNTGDAWVKGKAPNGSDMDSDGWEYYYYQSPVDAGGQTTNLMDGFKFLPTAGGKTYDIDTYYNYKGTIEVRAQAIQSDYVADTTGNLTYDGSGKIVGWNSTAFAFTA